MVRQIPADVLVFPKDPITLVGPPDRMSGKVRLRNTSEERIVITEGVLRGSLPGSAGKGEDSDFEGVVRMTAIVPPGRSAEVPIRAQLPASMPPGQYRAALVLGENSYAVDLLVAEVVKTAVLPTRVLVSGAPGRVSKSVIVINKGNVPVTVGSFGAVPLENELLMCSVIRGTLKNATADVETINQWASLYFRTAAKHLADLGMLWVNIDRPVTIDPGKAVSVGLMIRVPQLPPGRYTANIRFHDTDFEIVIVPAGTALSKDPADHPKDSAAVPNGATKTRRPK